MSTASLPPRLPLPTLLEGDPALPSAPSLRRDRGVLTQLRGVESGRVCGFEESWTTLGRSPECTHRFDDGSMSRTHARIGRIDGAFVIEDLGSSNGTWVNEQRIERRYLQDGDRIRLGRTVSMRFQMVDRAEQASLEQLYASSVQDGLTGTFSRRYFDMRLGAELSYARRHATDLALVLFDLDHFKKVNDTHGHPAGDAVLRAVAQRTAQALRREDVLCRYGGEEFAVIARGIPAAHADALGERVRAAIAASAIDVGSTTIACTVSVGVSTLLALAEPSGEALVALADARLYEAKQSGRNRVVAG